MTTTDKRQAVTSRDRAERALAAIDGSDDPRNLPAGLDGIGHALLAIHDELRAIRDHVVPTSAESEPEQPLADWERDLVATSGTETERLLAAECDRLRTERDQAWTQIISLTGERDDLRAAVARVETLADEWAAAGCDGSDDTHPPTASRMCTSCASADLRAALGGERA